MYHVYNRGVNKQDIFKDERDYGVFLSFLKYALLPEDELEKHIVIDKDIISIAQRFNLRRERLVGSVELISYCLMPNHFHLLLYQKDQDAITRLMRSLATGYAVYFNKRYKRVGSLFQGKYKASHIRTQGYWDHISRYIHLNPLDIGKEYIDYNYSSYRYFVGEAEASWVNHELITDGFLTVDEYKKFVEDYVPYKNDLKNIKDLLANSRELED